MIPLFIRRMSNVQQCILILSLFIAGCACAMVGIAYGMQDKHIIALGMLILGIYAVRYSVRLSHSL